VTSRGNEYKEGLRAFKMGDYAKAYRMLKYFAAEGDQEAQVAVGSICQLGSGGLPIDEDEAVRWYTLASEKGSGLASNNLGTIAMLRGDREAAIQWYSKARQQGFRHSPRLRPMKRASK
jgi:TPR repeat protein